MISLMNRVRISRSWPFIVTEHLNAGDNRWEDCCRFFCRNPAQDDHEDVRIPIAGFKLVLPPFQAFGLFVILEMEFFQNGGYLADGMGLGKVKLPTTRFETATKQRL